MTHPSVEQLRRLLGEQPLSDERESVETHVNGCDVCLELLEAWQRLQPADWGLLADLLFQQPSADVARGSSADSCPNADPAARPSSWPTFIGYELLDHVGSGGMGQVYQAQQVRTGRMVALKTLAIGSGSASDEVERLARFRTEVEAVTRLQHPNIVAVYDVGEQDGRPYFTMEWVGGGSLAEHLAGRPQAERLTADFLAVLAEAMHHAHRQGVIHRDLKPANVLLQKDEGGRMKDEGSKDRSDSSFIVHPLSFIPKITDFGVAKLADKVAAPTRPNQWIGTPEYMAPEQVSQGATVGPAADIYALGVLLYEMLTGRPPLNAGEPLETMRQVRDEEPIAPRRLRPRLSRDLETICLKCLHKQPARRYPTAQALADDLRNWLAGEAILARPCGGVERVVKWSKRHPERALLLVLALFLVSAMGVAYVWQLWGSNVRHARQLAASVDHQLLLIKYAVNQTAQDARLRETLSGQPVDHVRLRMLLEETKQAFMRWFARPGEQPPIINWFVMDLEGTILGDSYEDPKSVGKNYGFRDYFAGLMAQDPYSDRVYISRLYESEQDDRHKFTVITRIRAGERVLGLIGASVAVDARMVALDMRRELPGARLVGPLDHNRRSEDEVPATQPPFVVVLHRDYAVAGQKPVAVTGTESAMLVCFAADATLAEATDYLNSNGAHVNYVRVGDSQFVIIVEHPYPWPLKWVLQRPLTLGASIMLAAGVLTLLRRLPARQRPVAASAL
jgi:serine/threonine-protein kinase